MPKPFLTRRAVLAGAISLTMLFAAGCSQQDTGSTTTTSDSTKMADGEKKEGIPPAPEGTMKVGLITPGKISDKGWNASANAGLQRIKTELGAEVVPAVEGPAPSEVAGAAENLAQQGCQLIFFHGSEFDDAAAEVAPKFPKTTFVVVGGRTEKPNLTPIQFSAGEGTYLAGMTAASLSKSGKLACIGAAKIPIVEDSFKSFEKGAKAVKPDATVQITFIGDEADLGKGKTQAKALLDSGVDVIMHNANAAGQGVAQAVSEKPGTIFIGANVDQSELAPTQTVGSFIVDAPNAYLAVAKAVKAGKGTGKAYAAGLKDKAVGFTLNPKFAAGVPAEVKTKLEQAEKDIANGKINANP